MPIKTVFTKQANIEDFTMMLYKAVVILSLLGSPTIQVDDLRSPKGYETLEECYLRGTEMISTFASRAKIIYAFTICVENLQPKKEKGKDI